MRSARWLLPRQSLAPNAWKHFRGWAPTRSQGNDAPAALRPEIGSAGALQGGKREVSRETGEQTKEPLLLPGLLAQLLPLQETGLYRAGPRTGRRRGRMVTNIARPGHQLFTYFVSLASLSHTTGKVWLAPCLPLPSSASAPGTSCPGWEAGTVCDIGCCSPKLCGTLTITFEVQCPILIFGSQCNVSMT